MISWNQKDFLLAIILQLDLFHHQLWLVSGFITKAYLSQWAAVGDKEEKLPELAGLHSGNNLNCLSACLALTLERKRLRETQIGPCPPHCLFSSGPATQASESVLCRWHQCGNVAYEQRAQKDWVCLGHGRHGTERQGDEEEKYPGEEEGDFCGLLSSLARTEGYGLKCQQRRFGLVVKKSFLIVHISSWHRSHCFLTSVLTGSPAANHLCYPLTNLEVIKAKLF